MPLDPIETTIPRPIIGHKDTECEIAWLADDGAICITEFPRQLYEELKKKGFVDQVVTKQ